MSQEKQQELDAAAAKAKEEEDAAKHRDNRLALCIALLKNGHWTLAESVRFIRQLLCLCVCVCFCLSVWCMCVCLSF